jgi:hypothetical protein
MLCCAVLCCAVLCCAVLCCVADACSPNGNCPCPCNYAVDPGCGCRDLSSTLKVTVTKVGGGNHITFSCVWGVLCRGQHWHGDLLGCLNYSSCKLPCATADTDPAAALAAVYPPPFPTTHTQTPLWASYPITFVNRFNYKPYETVIVATSGSCKVCGEIECYRPDDIRSPG